MRSRRDIRSAERQQLRRKWMRKGIFSFIIVFILGTCITLGFYYAHHSKASLENMPRAVQPSDAATTPMVTHAPEVTVEPEASTSVESTNQPASPSEQAAPKPTIEAEDGQETVKLAFVGDILLASGVEDLMKRNGYDYPYTEVSALLQQPDLTIGNLETPVTERGEIFLKEYNYRSSPDALPALKGAGFDLVNLANNHVMDYGEEGLLDTLDYLDEARILRVGAGRDAAEAFKPVIIEKNGMKIAFLGFSRVVPDVTWKAGVNHPGVADTYDSRGPVSAIEKARAEADLVVVITHWGVERSDTPVAYQTELAHRFIDAGADLVIGSHPHVLQGIEAYKGKWVAYSLGNFIFTTNSINKTTETLILNATCTKERNCTLDAVPLETKQAKPIVMSAEQSQVLFNRISAVSFHAEIQPDGTIVEKP